MSATVPSSVAERAKRIARTSLVGVAANVLLAAFKAAVGLAAGSVSIAMDAVNNLTDALGSVLTLAGVALARRASLHAGVRYNPWTFRKGNPEDRFTDPDGDSERQFENRKRAFSLSFRYWPWYVYSGWWVYGRGQYMEYNRGGLIRHTAEEGDAFGVGAGLGYTRMLHKRWNLELGAGVWGGVKSYREYRCTNCGTTLENGRKPFVLPDDIFVSLVYVF